MIKFDSYLKDKLKDPRFRKLYEEERQLVELALRVNQAREELGLTQAEAARKANVTQQQMSRVENGVNCNMTTFLKVCQALELKLDLGKFKSRKRVA